MGSIKRATLIVCWTHLFASSALERFRLRLLFFGAKRLEQVLISDFAVSGFSFFGGHFLDVVNMQHQTGVDESLPR